MDEEAPFPQPAARTPIPEAAPAAVALSGPSVVVADQLTHLKIYNSADHPHEAQAPEVIEFARLNAKNTRSN